MGWLDKLLGREKSETKERPAEAPEAPTMPESPPASPAPGATEPAPPTAADVEAGAAEARDEELRTENRIPPGTG